MKKETIKPLGENILVKLDKKESKTKGGIYLPENANQEEPQEGKVVAVGTSEEIKVKKNQRIIFAKFSGTEISRNKEEFKIIKNEDILAVIE